jgi:mono/diheme cytochrome c family protein
MRNPLLLTFLLLAAVAALGAPLQARQNPMKPTIDQEQLPTSFVPSGKQMFKEYCAACHGANARATAQPGPLSKFRPPT